MFRYILCFTPFLPCLCPLFFGFIINQFFSTLFIFSSSDNFHQDLMLCYNLIHWEHSRNLFFFLSLNGVGENAVKMSVDGTIPLQKEFVNRIVRINILYTQIKHIEIDYLIDITFGYLSMSVNSSLNGFIFDRLHFASLTLHVLLLLSIVHDDLNIENRSFFPH